MQNRGLLKLLQRYWGPGLFHPITRRDPPLVGGFNPFEKYESKWVQLPHFKGVKIPKIFELPPPNLHVSTIFVLDAQKNQLANFPHRGPEGHLGQGSQCHSIYFPIVRKDPQSVGQLFFKTY